ncbi:lipopolysaccharide biosynthesis protein [Photobacterium frigidiphilum]|uniref:Lipopolysaccharide biosynthesis protein n=1 Tax=Photobacterium frigidiphilum TaxID=264736 RepID=A0A2T3JMM4_9GAMM|nr:oligosaccharide flippase family protein [Photobacterium frigidiphilum]PSU50267.1 lipopolysaccharide biosynthesis protein [Photobacterium frigidiphilum]
MSAIKQSLYYGVGIVMMKGVSLLMMPYVTGHLPTKEYGSLEVLILLADIGTILVGFGLIDAMYRYVGSSEGKKRQLLIANCFSLSLIAAVMGGVIVWLIMPWLLLYIPAKVEVYQVVLIAIPTLLDGLIAIPLTLMRMQSLAKWFCIFNVIKAIVQALLIVIMLEHGLGIDGVLIASTASSILMLVFLLKFQWQQMGRLGYLGYSLPLLKFGGPIVISGIGMFAVTGLDKWILADKVNVEALAVYAISAKFALILSLLMQPFCLWWFPNRIKILQQDNGTQQCAEKAILGCNLIVFLAFSMLLTVPSFIYLCLPSDYYLAAKLSVALILVSAIKNLSELMNLGCFSGESSQKQMWIQCLCAVIAVVGYYFLIPLYGVWAAVAVLGSVYSMRLVLFYCVSQSLEPLPYKHAYWIKTLCICSMAYLFHSVISTMFSTWMVFISGGVISIFTIILLVYLNTFPNLRSQLTGKFTSLNFRYITNFRKV